MEMEWAILHTLQSRLLYNSDHVSTDVHHFNSLALHAMTMGRQAIVVACTRRATEAVEADRQLLP
jgi:hypothetical protein